MKIQENTPITIKITGGITPTSIQVYEVINEQEYLTSYKYPGIIPLNSEIPLNLDISGNPRSITYRIRVIDKNNTFATTVDETNYVEVNIDYKEIEVYELNLSSINSLIVKNYKIKLLLLRQDIFNQQRVIPQIYIQEIPLFLELWSKLNKIIIELLYLVL